MTRTPDRSADTLASSGEQERDVDWTTDAVVAVDDRGIVRLSNHRADELFGYASDEMASRPVQTLIRGRVRQRGSCAAGLRKDGTEFPVEISLHSLATSEGLLMLAVLREAAVTGQRHARRRSVGAPPCDSTTVRPPRRAAAQPRGDFLFASEAAHRLNNALAAVTNYASLATANLRREVLRRDLADDGPFSDVLADVARISDAARYAARLMSAPPTEVAVAAWAHRGAEPAGVDLGTDGALAYAHAAELPSRPRQTVLVVDDDAAVRDSAGRLLQLEGYAVIEADDAEAALALSAAHAGKIDLLLTDFAMPGTGGGELRAAIAVRRPDTKVLFMTGYGHRPFVRRGIQGHRDNVIHKPFSAADLYRKVADVLTEA